MSRYVFEKSATLRVTIQDAEDEDEAYDEACATSEPDWEIVEGGDWDCVESDYEEKD